MSAKPIRVKQIDHISIVVKDLEASRRFYVDVLGMEPAPRPNFSFDGLWFQAGSTLVHLILEHPESGPADRDQPLHLQVSRTRHVAFEVDNALEAKVRLDELGIPIASGPKSRPDGPIQLTIFDPDNNLVELFSY
ncbi:MAG TPA: VOC family protein [Planctomicrobium sp.]|nr:VOC family protein [Planctomicrobium sp.]